MEFGYQAATSAWRRLAGGSQHGDLQVVVNPDSWLAPRGWIGIVAIGQTITASVPTVELRLIVEDVLRGLGSEQATHADLMSSRLPATKGTLGPAQLFYPLQNFGPAEEDSDEAAAAELVPLLAAADEEDLDESGVAHIDSTAFVSRSTDGSVIAACGYRRWPNGVAHLSVLTHPGYRRCGHGRRAAAAAIRHAIGEGLLPQWRARPVASQQLAAGIGLVHMGAQLSLQP